MPIISNAGVKRKGTDVPKGIIIIMTELVCITSRKNLKGIRVTALMIKEEVKRDLENAFLSLVRCIQNKLPYFDD